VHEITLSAADTSFLHALFEQEREMRRFTTAP